MNIVNLTPHVLNVYKENGEWAATVPPSGTTARIKVERKLTGERSGVPLFETVAGECDELPAPQENTIYVVSGFVRAAVADRADVFQPGELLRNDAGQVVGCIGLSR